MDFKSYVAMFHVKVVDFLDRASQSTAPTLDDHFAAVVADQAEAASL